MHGSPTDLVLLCFKTVDVSVKGRKGVENRMQGDSDV